MSLPSLPARAVRCARGARGDPLAGLMAALAKTRPGADAGLITTAYQASACWHHGQKRRSGDPYITHPVAVATILAEIGADDPTVCAALLHDVVEDTPCTLAMLRSEFGDEITDMVDRTMALDTVAADQLGFTGADAGAAVAALGGERALAVKVADRLHNMRTLRYLPPTKQVLKSQQVLEIFTPMALALSMDAIGSELHSLAATTLARHQRSRMASGRVLAAAVTLLPASARDRWREEWLAELFVLGTRRERVTFVTQVFVGMGRLAVTLYRPAAVLRRAYSALFAAVVTVGGLFMGGWRAAVAAAAAIAAILAVLMWVLRSEERTDQLARLIGAFRGPPGKR